MSTCWLFNKVDVNMLLKVHFQPNLGHETQQMMGQTIYSRRTSLSTEWFGRLHTHVKPLHWSSRLQSHSESWPDTL